jgi:hypothetical protein
MESSREANSYLCPVAVPILYGVWGFITVFIRICQWSISWAELVQLTPHNTTFCNLILSVHVCMHVTVCLSMHLSSYVIPGCQLRSVCISYYHHACCVPYHSHSPWFWTLQLYLKEKYQRWSSFLWIFPQLLVSSSTIKYSAELPVLKHLCSCLTMEEKVLYP